MGHDTLLLLGQQVSRFGEVVPDGLAIGGLGIESLQLLLHAFLQVDLLEFAQDEGVIVVFLLGVFLKVLQLL